MLLRAVDGAVRPRRGGRRLENVLLLPGRPERGTALPGCSLCQHGRSLSSWASRAWGWTAGAGAGPRLCPRRRSATRSRRCAGKWPRECRRCRWVQPPPSAMAAPPGRGGGARGCGARGWGCGRGAAGAGGPWGGSGGRRRPRALGARAPHRRPGVGRGAGGLARQAGRSGPEQARPRVPRPAPAPEQARPARAAEQQAPRPRAGRARCGRREDAPRGRRRGPSGAVTVAPTPAGLAFALGPPHLCPGRVRTECPIGCTPSPLRQKDFY